MAILTFHNINSKFIPGLTNYSPERFRKLLIYLKDSGVEFCSLDDYLNKRNPDKTVTVTFDDGYVDFYEQALPILKELMIPSTVFIPSGYIDSKAEWDYHARFTGISHMSESQIKECVDAGVTIGSHGVSHRCLTGLKPDEMLKELEISKRKLESLTGGEVRYIAYPFGRFDRYVEEAALTCKYKCGFSLSFLKRSPLVFTIPRYPVYSCDCRWAVKHKTESGYLNLIERLKGSIFNSFSYGTILLNKFRKNRIDLD